MQTLYPLKFQPILKDKIWGGEKLFEVLNKNSNSSNVGESWEISDVENDISIVSNGMFKGQSLRQLILQYGSSLLGIKNYKHFGNKFPLLIKLIDAKKDLSIQLHPNDKLAAARHNSLGKTEMWYVMQAEKDANLIAGFNQSITPDLYLQHLKKKTLPEILNFDKVEKGDVYFIETGTIHAIGAGVLLAEIQQTSDITYRVYDWDRVDANGNERELHNELAIGAIDFSKRNDFKIDYKKTENTLNTIVSCPYFTTNYLYLNSEIKKENNHDSFIIYICTEGEAKIAGETLFKGETLLVPASINTFSIEAKNAELLEVYI